MSQFGLNSIIKLSLLGTVFFCFNFFESTFADPSLNLNQSIQLFSNQTLEAAVEGRQTFDSLKPNSLTYWIALNGQVNKEKFHIKFPAIYQHIQETDTFIAATLVNGTAYALLVAPLPEIEFNAEEQFGELLEEISKTATVLEYESKKMQGRSTLDLFVRYSEKGNYAKIRIVLSKKNLYSMITQFEEGAEEQHNLFISSFSINS